MEVKDFIVCKNLDFGYDNSRNVLSNIDFSLPKGQTLAIVGASGCGKSTLLRIISGILPSTKSSQITGEVVVNGLSPNEYRKTGKLAFMFQEATLLPNLTVRENVALPLKINGKPNYEKVDALISMVGLTDYAQYLPKQLSGGMKTRVALARSFATEPELLLLDEPFSALDAAWKAKLFKELENFKIKFGTTLIMVTHDVQEAVMLSNRVITLKSKGSIGNKEKIDLGNDDSIIKRIDRGHKFFENEKAKNAMRSIQASIMIDGLRYITVEKEANEIIDRILSNAKAGIEYWDTFEQDTLCIRNFSGKQHNHNKLVEAFRISKTKEFKYQLIWDVLHYDNISDEGMKTVLEFYLNNAQYASMQALSYYQSTKEDIVAFLKESRITKDYSQSKRWIYLCDMYASSQVNEVLKYYQDVIQGNVDLLNYDFAKSVAQQMKNKIEDESARGIN